MAAGDRKVKIGQYVTFRANPVRWACPWELYIEDKLGVDRLSMNGTSFGSFGTPAAWRAMTGLQMENQVLADVAADSNTPARDSVS